MKTRVRSCAIKSSTTTYLKPGALAQLRYSKITAKSREVGAQTLLALRQLEQRSDSAISGPDSSDFSRDGIPCFNFRVTKNPRCIQRKKLVAVTPFFQRLNPDSFSCLNSSCSSLA